MQSDEKHARLEQVASEVREVLEKHGVFIGRSWYENEIILVELDDLFDMKDNLKGSPSIPFKQNNLPSE